MDFEEYYEQCREEIDEHIKQILYETENDADIRSMLHYGIEGGKRFRPTLCLLMNDIYDGDKQEALDNAGLVELIHASSLLHDDVVDDDTVRRGMPTFWKALSKIPWIGPPELDPKNMAVLLGDDMWSIALTLISDIRMMKAVVETIRAIAEGAVVESKSLVRTKLFGTEVDDYLKVIKLKTASMFALSTHLGSMPSHPKLSEEETARKTGMIIGICYQIADDLSEDDVPSGVDAKGLMLEYANKFDELVEELPENKYRDMYKTVLPFMVNAIIEQEGKELTLARTEDGFAWIT